MNAVAFFLSYSMPFSTQCNSRSRSREKTKLSSENKIKSQRLQLSVVRKRLNLRRYKRAGPLGNLSALSNLCQFSAIRTKHDLVCQHYMCIVLVSLSTTIKKKKQINYHMTGDVFNSSSNNIALNK